MVGGPPHARRRSWEARLCDEAVRAANASGDSALAREQAAALQAALQRERSLEAERRELGLQVRARAARSRVPCTLMRIDRRIA